MIRALCRAIVRVSARVVPRMARARWREEWLAEIDAARPPGWRLASRIAAYVPARRAARVDPLLALRAD